MGEGLRVLVNGLNLGHNRVHYQAEDQCADKIDNEITNCCNFI
jgi:hypothetical protein